jgi:cation transporter-like permease
VFQPIVNGIGGNLVALFASRLSTALHQTSLMGTFADWSPASFLAYPIETFFSKKSIKFFAFCANFAENFPQRFFSHDFLTNV